MTFDVPSVGVTGMQSGDWWGQFQPAVVKVIEGGVCLAVDVLLQYKYNTNSGKFEWGPLFLFEGEY